MTWNLMIDGDCVTATLRAGSRVHCRAGQLWITVEHARAVASDDIVLHAGQSHAVAEDATYFLGALRGAGVVLCDISPAAQERLQLRLT